MIKRKVLKIAVIMLRFDKLIQFKLTLTVDKKKSPPAREDSHSRVQLQASNYIIYFLESFTSSYSTSDTLFPSEDPAF